MSPLPDPRLLQEVGDLTHLIRRVIQAQSIISRSRNVASQYNVGKIIVLSRMAY
ncbi:hypothetical protein MC7420_3548 [Coleofasciculus chthonoplastes PCC 7420]|uniref:Uncharacterized protein n=1 Tax=Coleofasciculus chthonoplastes PCC 7420 TaxID=118168 RepID=B4W000_9CYAN|nr:hypothetical protein [Coleofasciculus chthonoplastes]EDX72476.1 hypothetical protein MC7420_3548 [Coleofasciculus chthonoplastes PCC 7420]